MATETLVDNQIEERYEFIRQLNVDKFDVAAACWMKLREEGDSFLYIASTLVDEKGLAEAYRLAYATLQRMPTQYISESEIKLIRLANPIARDVIAIRDSNPQSTPVQYRGQQLGGVAIDEAVIFPASVSSGGLDIIVKGRDEVLKYLEGEAESRTGKTGEYLVARDGRGNLVAIVAGHSFVGSGAMFIPGNRFELNDGIVVSVQGTPFKG